MHRFPISGVVIARNESDRIHRCVASLARLCAEVVVVDSGSDDDTVGIAQRAGARVVHQDWLGFAAQKNAAIAFAEQPWVLLLDADEWLPDGVEAELERLFASSADRSAKAEHANVEHASAEHARAEHAKVESADVWRLVRRTHFLGRPLRFGGWGRERVERLFRPDLRYLPAEVHEKLDLRGRRIGLAPIRIEHDTARSYQEYADKLRRYAQLWATQRRKAGKRAGALSAPVHAAAYLLKNYVLRGGVLDGVAGWRYHMCHAGYVYRKYRLLAGGR